MFVAGKYLLMERQVQSAAAAAVTAVLKCVAVSVGGLVATAAVCHALAAGLARCG
jgi:hypothetical protein